MIDDILKIVGGAIAGPILVLVALFVMRYTFTYIGIDPEPAFSFVVALSPLWIPFLLFFLLYNKWVEYVQLKWNVKNDRRTLRIKLPQEVFKSPEAMEAVFSGLYSGGAGENLMEVYLDGLHPYTLSFEIISRGGEVRFYINVPGEKIKNTVEALLYAQYPGIEVVEEDHDYASEVPWDPKRFAVLPFHIAKKENEIFPIKTYIDFGMDKLPKEEEKNEPLAPLIAQLSRVRPNHQVWIQILIKGRGKRGIMTGQLHSQDTWHKAIDAKISELLLRDKQKQGAPESELQPRLSKGEQDLIAAMERNAGKFAFEVAIRMMTVAPANDFTTELITPLLRAFAQFEILKRNGLGVKWRANYDYNFIADWSGKKRTKLKKLELLDYKLRHYHTRDHPKHRDHMSIMSTEELATIFHIPGTSVSSPSLPRILSARKDAPSNLPTGNLPQ